MVERKVTIIYVKQIFWLLRNKKELAEFSTFFDSYEKNDMQRNLLDVPLNNFPFEQHFRNTKWTFIVKTPQLIKKLQLIKKVTLWRVLRQEMC